MDLDLDSEDIQIEKYPTAYKVYQDLWSEFYNWERLFCQQNLEGLSKSVIHPRSRFHHAGEMYDLPSFSSSEEDFFTYEDISFDSTVSTKFTFSPNPKIIQSQTLEPSAGYTACTAISTNIIQKDDPASLSFAPHADDPLFALDDYLSHAGWFTWQFDFKDPDLEMIQLEAVRRLRHGSGFDDAEIDSLHIFPPLRESNRSGLIWYSSQRDFLWWPGSQISDLNPISTNFVDHKLQIHENVLKDAKSFCPNLNCIQTHCSIHKVETNELFPPKALITNGSMMSNLENKCGDFCYKDEKYHLPAGTEKENDHWSDQERSEVESLFKLMPDTSPCDMAIICRKPCFEIYIHRKLESIFSDEKILENQQPPIKHAKKKIDEDIDKFLWTVTCHHLGPCNQYTNCTCYNTPQGCQRMCSCAKNCSLKFKGCKCHSKRNRKLCMPSSGCPCAESRRECNPELCLKCDARKVIYSSTQASIFQSHGFLFFKGEKQSQNLCQNNKLQKAQFPAVSIHKSKYGSGAFAAQDIAKNSYVGEYVALIYDMNDLNDSEGNHGQMLAPLQKFTGLNYSFQVNPNFVLDALSVGNEMRYINDSRTLPDDDSNKSIPQPPTISPNCEASVWLVNDVPRIAFTATKMIKQGRELYLDYGDGYWGIVQP